MRASGRVPEPDPAGLAAPANRVRVGISFAVIARYWRGRHSIFKDVRAYDGRLLNLNIAWLAAIAVLPFPSTMIAQQLTGGFESLYLLIPSQAIGSRLSRRRPRVTEPVWLTGWSLGRCASVAGRSRHE